MSKINSTSESALMNDPEHPNPIDVGKENTPEEIAQRRILKIKGPKQQEESTAPKKLILLAKVVGGEKKQEEIIIPSKQQVKEATNAQENKNSEQPKVQQATEVIKPAPVVVGTTAPLVTKSPAPIVTAAPVTPVIAPSTTSVAAETPKQSLFGNLPVKPAGSGIFGTVPTTTGGLFGNPSSVGTGLFANIASDNKKPTEKISNIFSTSGQPVGSLFGTPTISTGTSSLFGNPKPAEGSSLFGNLSQPAANSGLFSALKSGDAVKASVAAGSDDEGGDGDEDDELEQSPEIDPSKVEIHYVYNNPYEKIVDKSIAKLRRGTHDVIEKGFLSLEKHKTDENALSILVYRNQIKTVIFSMQVIKKVTKVEKINNSSKNLKFTLFKKGEKGFEAEVIKVQFLDEADGNEFFEKMTAQLV